MRNHAISKYFLLAVLLLNGCAAEIPVQETKAELAPETISKVELMQLSNGSFLFPNLYWANPVGVAANWDAVYGGTVTEVKSESDDPADKDSRKFVEGAIKVEKIFLNLPDSSEIDIGSTIRSEDFDGLKKDDKVIVFINNKYEGGYVRVKIEGTNSKLGFKVKDWNDPIVSALEKVAPCDKIRIGWIEGFPKDFRAKLYDCYKERRNLIFDDPQISEIWKKNDPNGFQSLIESRQYENEN